MTTTPPALEKLQALRNHGSKFGVDRMRRLASLLGNPERRLPCIHVAGTNGKGSTCAMIEAIQRAHGRTTGLYTSPHLVRLGERVQINRKPLPEKALLRYCDELFPLVDRMEAEDSELRPSFFELMTAMAFLAFAREPVDIAVIEVGLGGRLDATNILEKPLVTVITSIGLDHTDLLGTSIEAIAAEKAGILKPGVPLALGLVPPAAETVIRARAAELGVVVHAVAEKADTNLAGAHQGANAGLALLACRLAAEQSAQAHLPGAMGFDEPTARRALRQVDWAGRWQTLPLSQNRTLILDVAHNEEGARALDGNLARLTAESGKTPTPDNHPLKTDNARAAIPSRAPVLIVGVLGLDRARPILEVASRHARAIVLVRPDNERACSLDELRACIPSNFPGPVSTGDLATIFPATGVCTLGDPGDTIVVAGSVYLAGEVLSRFAEDRPCDEYTKYQDRLPGAKS